MKMSAMKAMKMSMKMKAMSSMKMKMAMKVSTKGKKWQVFKGTKLSTKGGLKKSDLKKSKTGKIVSAKASAASKKKYANGIGKWNVAVTKARKALGIKGFLAVGGKKKEGQVLLAKARSSTRSKCA